MAVKDILILSLEADAVVLARAGGRDDAGELDRESVAPGAADASAALDALGRRHPGRHVTLLVPPELLLVRMLRLPGTPRARAQVARFETERVAPVPLERLTWGCAGLAENDGLTEALLFAARLDAMERLCAAVEAAGFRVEAAWPSTLAAVAALRDGGETSDRAPRLLVVPGARAVEVILVDGERVAVRVALVADGSGDEPANVRAAEVARTMRSFREAGFAVPAAVAVAGLADSEFGVWTEALRAHAQLAVSVNDSAAALRRFGAAILAAQPASRRVELLPPVRRARIAWRRRTPWLAAAAALTIAAWVPAIAHERAAAADARSEADRLEAELAPWREREATRAGQLARLDAVKQQIAAAEAAAAARVRWSRLLADLESRVGAVGDAWLERLVPRPTPGTTTGRIEVAGWLIDREESAVHASPAAQARVRRLFELLRESPLIAGVAAERATAPEPGVLRFSCELVLREEGSSP